VEPGGAKRGERIKVEVKGSEENQKKKEKRTRERGGPKSMCSTNEKKKEKRFFLGGYTGEGGKQSQLKQIFEKAHKTIKLSPKKVQNHTEGAKKETELKIGNNLISACGLKEVHNKEKRRSRSPNHGTKVDETDTSYISIRNEWTGIPAKPGETSWGTLRTRTTMKVTAPQTGKSKNP